MVSPYESLLRDKARALITALQREGLPVEAEPHQPSEYGIKVRLTTCGNVVIYYKPVDGTFKLTFNELTCKQHQPAVQICWDRLNASQNGQVLESEDQACIDSLPHAEDTGNGAGISSNHAISHSEIDEAARPDRLEQLRKTGVAFVCYLADQGIAGTFAGVFNNQYARIKIGGGYFDLYDTAKRRIPHIHGINDPSLKEGLETLWSVFRGHTTANPQSSSESAENPFEEVEYYFELLRPYRGLCFDFTMLADALKPLVGCGRALPTDDFDALERIYEQIRTEQ